MNQTQKRHSFLKPLQLLWNHDLYTFQHSLRVADLIYKFGYFLEMSEEELLELYELGGQHDIGKLKVPVTILNKKGKLNELELESLYQHPITGYDMLKEDDYSPSFLDGVLYHHENYDGTGYPYQLKGDEIPYYAKMLRIVDSYDAMTNDRSYSKAKTPHTALKEIHDLSGSMYDPELAQKFLSMFKIEHI